MDRLLADIEATAREAAQIMLKAGNSPAHAKEGHYNYVTDADVQVQKLLIERLHALVPDAEFLAEEQDNQRLSAAPTFIIDPIDGTLNFMRSRQCSAISIALLRERRPVLGLIYDPYRDELFTATLGGGARLNGHEIRVSDVPLERAMVGIGTSPYNPALARRTLDIACEFLLSAGDLRRIGSAALDLCYIACGRADVYYELQLSPWDFAAGALIVSEAGGRFALPRNGRADELDFGVPGCVLATNVRCYQAALDVLMRHGV